MITVTRILHKSLIGLVVLATVASCVWCHADDATAKNESLVDFSIRLELPKGSSEGTLIVTAKLVQKPLLDDPYHIYSTRSKPVNGGRATRVLLDQGSPWELVGENFVADQRPHTGKEPGLNPGDPDEPIEYFEKQVTWKRQIRLKPGTDSASGEVAGIVKCQVCDKNFCRYPQHKFKIPVTVVDQVAQATPVSEPGSPPLLAPGQDQENAQPGELPTSIPAPGAAHAPEPAPAKTTTAAASPAKDAEVLDPAPTTAGVGIDKSKGLWVFLLTAVAMGFGALLTPCVFPMIPITISFFNKQAEKEHHRPITMASVYCLGIIGTFTILGMVISVLFGAASLNKFASGTGFSLFLAAVLLFFGFSLLGMYELRLPSWLLTATSGQQSRGGYLGVLFMALTFTLTSFTCTFAFAGGLLVAAMEGERLWPVLGLLAFSTAFALPFFFLAIFPSLMQKMPKSGGWMNVVKVIMGMVEIGAAFKFLSQADFTFNRDPWLFDFEVVVASWMVISITTAIYLMGLFRLSHDSESSHVGAGRLLLSMTFLGLGVYLAIGLFAPRPPAGKLWETIQALAPPRSDNGHQVAVGGHHFVKPNWESPAPGIQDLRPEGPVISHHGLSFGLEVEKALELAVRENRPLLVEFTGVNCANCRKMEKGPMARADVKDRLARMVKVQVFCDSMPPNSWLVDPSQAYSAEQGEEKLDANRELQQSWFKDASLPAYGIVPPDPEVLKDPNQFLSRYIGMEQKQGEFTQFLDQGLSRWKNKQAKKGAGAVRSVNHTAADGSLIGSRK